MNAWMKGSMNANMGNQNTKRKKRNNNSKKKHRIYAVVVLILAAAILILGIGLLFYIQEIQIEGNTYSDSQEILSCVKNDKLSVNSIYVTAKYAVGKGKKPQCLETMQVKMVNPWTIKVTVKEKTIIGCVKEGRNYEYFDQEGFVVRTSQVKDSGIPIISGMKIKNAKLYENIKTSQQTKFRMILEACTDSQKYGITPEKIEIKDQQIYMEFGNVSVCLGNQVSAEQIAQIKPILKKLDGKSGILHLETYSENNTTITFEMEEISQEN